MSFYGWRPHVPAAARQANAQREMEKLRKNGIAIQPVKPEGRKIAHSFWGKAWCDHLESFSDYGNRLPRGRTYVRNGSVCHLEIKGGNIEAMVCGSSLYNVMVTLEPMAEAWHAVKQKCRGQIGSLLELLQGRLSDNVMAIVSDRRHGLFPQMGEMKFTCSCPDWAEMCKHVAAVLYGVGHRLDSAPELLFALRGVDASELIAAEVALPASAGSTEGVLGEAGLSALFGIDLEDGPTTRPVKPGAFRASEPSIGKGRKAEPKSGKKAAAAAAAVAASKPAKRQGKGAARPGATPPAGKIRDKSKALAAAKKGVRGKAKPPVAPTFNLEPPTGAAIALLRTQAGYSMARFAKTIGVSVASVYRWESIAGPLNIQTRHLIALGRFQKRGARR